MQASRRRYGVGGGAVVEDLQLTADQDSRTRLARKPARLKPRLEAAKCWPIPARPLLARARRPSEWKKDLFPRRLAMLRGRQPARGCGCRDQPEVALVGPPQSPGLSFSVTWRLPRPASASADAAGCGRRRARPLPRSSSAAPVRRGIGSDVTAPAPECRVPASGRRSARSSFLLPRRPGSSPRSRNGQWIEIRRHTAGASRRPPS